MRSIGPIRRGMDRREHVLQTDDRGHGTPPRATRAKPGEGRQDPRLWATGGALPATRRSHATGRANTRPPGICGAFQVRAQES